MFSYIVRWIQVPDQQSISWSVEPHKKSINFGIFKHPGTKGGLAPVLPTHDTVDGTASAPATPALDGAPVTKRGRQGSVGRSDTSNAVEKLEAIGLKRVAWAGKCEADKVAMGRFDVADGEGGTYGMVFDNTFSKQTSKTVHFVLMTHPTNAPPKSGHHLHYSQAFAANSNSTIAKSYSPSLQPITDSSESLPQGSPLFRAVLEDPRPASKGGRGVETRGMEGSSFYTGTLNKKRRKKGQGYAKRFFSLDYTSSTLSYYRDRHSSALRGAVPLSLAAVGVDEKRREFSIDSGAEVWHLKAPNKKEFEGWRDALERAASPPTVTGAEPVMPMKSLVNLPRLPAPNPAEDREWQMVEELVSKVSGTRDAIRGFAKDTDPKYLPGVNGAGLGLTTSRGSSTAPSPIDPTTSYFPDNAGEDREKRPFWRRKASTSTDRSTGGVIRRTVSAQLAVPSPGSLPPPMSPMPNNLAVHKRGSVPQVSQAADGVHERCMALLKDLDSVVADFSALVAQSKARRIPPLPTSASRMSFDSVNEEFFDAEDGGASPSQLLSIRRSEDEDASTEQDQDDDAESDASSDAGDAVQDSAFVATSSTKQSSLFPALPRSLPPLPLSPASRRTTISPPKQAPPSIIGFLRKNAGKDLSTVSMPVTANEPTSLLQRLAESLEYPHLLDAAASASTTTPAERLMYISAFAISYFSNNRVKERAIRKPFNPMLGETYELVREDLGFRFLAEKVSHHPVRMACQAESLNNGGWTFTQAPQPVQKFWGKSVELNTEGAARVVLHAVGEQYSWSQATCFLRNVIAGEKYVEPVLTMTIRCEGTGLRAVVTFKAGGMFSGRSEEVSVQLFDPGQGEEALELGLVGKWTEGLRRTDSGVAVWTVGQLVPDAPKTFGFTSFAAALNQVTAVEEGRLPPTDSRLRPDQQALENGEADHAEALKAKLEERQRARRKVLEGHGQTWEPRFFERLAGVAVAGEEEVWVAKAGKGGYWEMREERGWEEVRGVFET
ncbi:hypothetical protein LTR62_008094 [Meristemomyces frigidus]|uniref:PH domain-containing protein n=1 Tax=Meristemomyces frigidus TaxID=1508187 RepID=A0AAN7TIF2_9PEZI|nr:hypothetical protein LTR62_008094 [Meristemomyces frigidus]